MTERGSDVGDQATIDAEAPPKITKGIVVVHGMGDQPKGETLYRFANPIVTYMTEQRGTAPKVAAKMTDAAAEQPCTISVEYPGEQRWIFVEAWWAKSFRAAKFDPAVAWTANRMLKHLLALARTMGRYFLLALDSLLLYGQRRGNLLINEALLRLPVKGHDRARYDTYRCAADVNYARRLTRHLRDGFGKTISRYPLLALGSVAVDGQRRGSLLISKALLRLPVKGYDHTTYDRHRDAANEKHDRRSKGLREWSEKEPEKGPEATDDEAILEELREPHYYRDRTRFLRWLYLGVSLFHLLNAPIMFLIFALGLVLLIPGIVLLTALNLITGIPGIPKVAAGLKKALDTFLAGSMGDMQVFFERPVEAKQIRNEVEKALDFLRRKDCREIHLIAHSTGVPVCYETLVDRDNEKRTKDVKRLFTVGSIMRLAWQTRKRKGRGFWTQLQSVNQELQWHNFWARYDPAHPGPIGEEYARTTEDSHRPGRVKDIPVTNENSLLHDHVTYESNRAQVINRLVAEISGNDASSPFRQTRKQERANDILRITRVLTLGYPRLLLTYLVPILLVVFSLKLRLAAKWSHWLATLLSAGGWANEHLSFSIETSLGTGVWWEKVLVVLIAAGLMLLAGYILYLAYRNLWWEVREPVLF